MIFKSVEGNENYNIFQHSIISRDNLQYKLVLYKFLKDILDCTEEKDKE